MDMSFRTLAALCTLAITMNTGCTDNSGISSEGSVTPLLSGGTSESESVITPEHAEECDYTPAATADTSVVFSGNKASVKGSGAAASGSTVTITEAGVYEVSGECSDGKIIVDADKESSVTLLLNGLELSCKSGSAIDCEKAEKLLLTAAEGTMNIISDSESYSFAQDETEPDAAIFCRSDMVINGGGSLSVTGLYNDGIKCKDGLKICGGNITVNAAGDGIVGKDYLIVAAGALDITAGKDGLKSSNDKDSTLGYVRVQGGEIFVNSGSDAVQAETELIIDGGSVTAVAGGGSASVEHSQRDNDRGGWGGFKFDFDNNTENGSTESMKGLKAGVAVTVNGGGLDIDSADDSVHSGGTVLIRSGDIRLSSGDDGIHADANVTISGGDIYIEESYEGIEGTGIEVSGGNISVCAFDDGMNAAGDAVGSEYYISITGGNITVNADGDGLDSNGSMAMSGGTVVVFGPTTDVNGALDYESSFAISGGTLIALGAAGMAQVPSTLSQPCLAINSNVEAGSSIEVRDEEGGTVLSVETPKRAQSLIFSASSLSEGSVYGIYADGVLLSEVTAGDGVSGNGAQSGSWGFGGFGGHGGFGGGHGGFGGRGGGDWTGTDMPSSDFGRDKPDGEPPAIPEGDMGDPPSMPDGGQQPPDGAEPPNGAVPPDRAE